MIFCFFLVSIALNFLLPPLAYRFSGVPDACCAFGDSLKFPNCIQHVSHMRF